MARPSLAAQATDGRRLNSRSHLRLVSAGPDQESDAGLLSRATARDQQAFAALVERHFAIVFRVVWRMMKGHSDAEDMAQEAFLRLWRNPEQVREAAALRGWLIRVACNLVTDRYRTSEGGSIAELEEQADDRPAADEEIDKGRAAAAIDAAVAALPDRQRLALTLVHFEQMSQAAAAEVMEVSVEALESLLARARRALKTGLAPRKQELLTALAAERT
ncbi:MAG: sigma-70 family RNA polymerase sigma factor [Hyphomicrobiales bacterium]